MRKIGLVCARSQLACSMAEARGRRPDRTAVRDPPGFTMGGSGGGIFNLGVRGHLRSRALDLAEQRDPDRGVDRGLEGVRARGHPRQERQRHHRLLDRELRSDGSAHRRLDHGRTGADVERPRVPAHARRRDRVHPRDRRRHGRQQRAVRDPSARRPHGRDRDESAREPQLGAGQQATGFRIAKIAAKLAVGYTPDELDNDITKSHEACFEPTIDYCVVNFRAGPSKFPTADSVLTRR